MKGLGLWYLMPP